MLVNTLLALAALGALAAHSHALWHHRVRRLAGLAALDLALVVLAFAAMDDARWADWMREDAWVEWSTATAFFAAATLFAARAVRGGGWGRFAGAGLALFCFFVAGEELSWGQRIFAFQPPEIFLEQNFQQELNIHNLLTNKELAGFSLDSRFLVALIAVVYGVLGAVLGALPWCWARALAPPAALAPAFALVAAVELDYPMDRVGEAAEWFFGLSFLVDALLREPQRLPRVAWALLPGSVALGALTAPTLEALIYGSDTERVAQTRVEIDQLAADLSGALQPKIESKRRVHKRIYTAVVSGYLAFGDGGTFLEGQRSPAEDPDGGRTDRRGYFLDPWSNPYWLLWDERGEVRVVYSFGPNRRRDSDTRPFTAAGGDDIVAPIGR